MMVAIEGIDGTGKRTQAGLLRERAEREGSQAIVFSFPRYGTNAFAKMVTRYLNGEFGEVMEVPPELSALLFAGDRYAARSELADACRRHDLVICDRYVASNLAHQASRLPQAQWPEFIDWLRSIEYGLYGLPEPSLTVLLDLPVESASALVSRKAAREYTKLKADIHEQDTAYLDACRRVYLTLAEESGAKAWEKIWCLHGDGTLRDADDVAEELWSLVRQRLAQPPLRAIATGESR